MRIRFLYNSFWAVLLPFVFLWLLWGVLFKGKYRNHFAQKFGFRFPKIPPKKGGARIWIHAVSLGEMKSARVLIEMIQKERKDLSIVVSTVTDTGFEEARKIKGVSSLFFLPLDFFPLMSKVVRRVDADLLILVEGDFWWNMMNALPVIVVSAKLSERSKCRLARFPKFTKTLFQKTLFIGVQNELYLERFLQLALPLSSLDLLRNPPFQCFRVLLSHFSTFFRRSISTCVYGPSKESRKMAKIISKTGKEGYARGLLKVTGNLKFDIRLQRSDSELIRKELEIGPEEKVIVLASTHEPEEEELLHALEPLWKRVKCKILLVPRHKERFASIASRLEKLGIPFGLFSQDRSKPITLIDKMGYLVACYQVADLAVVAGSFSSKLGGHNIFEPIYFNVPTIFGPFMQAQQDLAKEALIRGAAVQVSIQNLLQVAEELLLNPPPSMSLGALQMREELFGSSRTTWEAITLFLPRSNHPTRE